MIYFYGAGGFVLGFALGLALINLFLRHYSPRDLVNNKALHRTYGLAVWIFAGLGTWGALWFYHHQGLE